MWILERVKFLENISIQSIRFSAQPSIVFFRPRLFFSFQLIDLFLFIYAFYRCSPSQFCSLGERPSFYDCWNIHLAHVRASATTIWLGLKRSVRNLQIDVQSREQQHNKFVFCNVNIIKEKNLKRNVYKFVKSEFVVISENQTLSTLLLWNYLKVSSRKNSYSCISKHNSREKAVGEKMEIIWNWRRPFFYAQRKSSDAKTEIKPSGGTLYWASRLVYIFSLPHKLGKNAIRRK